MIAQSSAAYLPESPLPRVIFLSGYVPLYPGQKLPMPFIVAQQESLEQVGVTVYPFYISGRRFFKYPGSILPWRRFVNQTGADLVHAHHSYNGALALAQQRLPVVVSMLGNDVFISQVMAKGEHARALVTYVMTQISAFAFSQVIVKTEEMGRKLWRKKHVHILPNGVNLDRFVPMPRDEACRAVGLSTDKRYVLFPASRTRPEKDYPLAEKAFLRACSKMPDVELLTLEAVPRERIPFLMNAADAILFTSKSEGAPNVIKEAMACSVPIVTVDIGDTRPTVEGTERCWVVERDPQLIAARLTEALSSKERSNGRERIQMYDQRIVAQRLIGIYRQALGELHAGRKEASAPRHAMSQRE